MPRYDQFLEDVAKKVHNLSADTLKLALTNTAPDAAAHSVLADITEISAGNGYSAGGATVSITSCEQVLGLLILILADVVITASGGSIGPFRYVVLYNDTPSSPANPLIAWWDYGSSLLLSSGDTFTTDFDATDGVLSIVIPGY